MGVGVNLNCLAQDRGTLRAVVSTAMDYQIPQIAEHLIEE